MTVTAYRITKSTFATSIWSGIGARDYGGRWNSKGVTVVYTAESRALAAMEQLVHLIRPRVLDGYVMASVTFDQSQIQRVDVGALPADWADPVAPPQLRRYGDDWVAAGSHAALGVPSAVIAGEWNYLLNPAHPDFSGLQKSSPLPFTYDYRLG